MSVSSRKQSKGAKQLTRVRALPRRVARATITIRREDWIKLPVALIAVYLSYRFGRSATLYGLAGMLGFVGALLLLGKPQMGLLILVFISLIGPLAVDTGTTVALNPTSLFIPALMILWFISKLRSGDPFVRSSVNWPLAVFLVVNLLSLVIGRALWDESVPVDDRFVLVQLAQWSIYAFSFMALWLAADVPNDRVWLKRCVYLYIIIGGIGALTRMSPVVESASNAYFTFALQRAPFWSLFVALAGGQLLYNKSLRPRYQIALILTCAAATFHAFVLARDSSSTWVGVGAVIGVLIWFRWRRLRIPIAFLGAILISTGFLFQTGYEYAGGDTAWELTGGSRLVLIERVVEDTLRNPLTGLGPAAYRRYTATRPLTYGEATWLDPQINSHNNYVDIFSQGGILALVVFGWLALEVSRVALRLRVRFETEEEDEFTAGYVNGMIAAGVSALILMLFADWMLPFVYNIGFIGFQSSIMFWFFTGGLLFLDSKEKMLAAERNRFDS